MFYATVSEFCTARECPVMSGGQTEYMWIDSQKKPVKVAAPVYVDYSTTFIQGLLDDENVFPTKSKRCFPKDHVQTVKGIFKHLFRILAHMYYSHYDKILHLREEGHLNTLFAHLITFSREFELLDKKDTESLKDLISELESRGLC